MMFRRAVCSSNPWWGMAFSYSVFYFGVKNMRLRQMKRMNRRCINSYHFIYNHNHYIRFSTNAAVNLSTVYEVNIALWHSEDDRKSAAASVGKTAAIVVENDIKTMYITSSEI